ncbi:MAG: mechanosensitive ion channel family protein [candidate division KSB1 bacterium]|nr:mechanosensitive ion channel family protein [candidate division KSB1 bacterium]MDQ7066455.1 mechanosensitive ion channel family protein [candidate division KSB1 bacterium]
MKRLYLLFTVLALSLSAATSPGAQTPTGGESAPETRANRMATPRSAVHNFLYWLQPSHYRPDVAAQAFAVDGSLSLDDRIRLARQLKRVLDARGLYVKIEAIPDDPDYRNEMTGEHEYMLFPQLPEVTLVKSGDKWLFSPQTLKAIPGLYRQTFNAWIEYMVDRLPAVFKKKLLNLALWQIAGVFVLLFIGLLVRRLAEWFIEHFAQRLVKRTRTRWDEKILEVSSRPVGLILMTLTYSALYSNLQFGVTTNMVIRVALQVLLYFGIIWWLYRLVDVLELYLKSITSKTETKLDDQLVPLLRKTLKIFIVTLGTIFALQNLNVNVTSLLTGLGLGGLAFALAARDTLANFFGSVTIFLDKPFQVGDWIITGDIEGTVEEVGFRSTRIRTFYNSLVSVPNAKIADAAIDNMGARQYRRIKMLLGLTYNTTAEQMQAFVEGIRAIVQANPYTRKDFYEIHFYEYGDFSLNVLLYVFLKVNSWSEELRERHNILLEILRLANEIGVEFAFPTQTIHVDSFYAEHPRQVGKKLPVEKMAEIVTEFGPGGKLARPSGPVLSYNGKVVQFVAKTDNPESRGSS